MSVHGEDAGMQHRPLIPKQPTHALPQPPGLDTPLSLPGEVAVSPHAGLAIIASKVTPAVSGRSVLTRTRLVGWLEHQRHARVTLITAEAGYGKSTLLSDFSVRSDAPCAWYRIETSDGDWITFLSYMVAALREVGPGFGKPTEALLRHVAAMGSSREVVLAQFLADLSMFEHHDLVVILDDYHLVEESEDVRMIVGRMLDRAPAAMRFVLSSRGKPDLALGRLAAQGRVSEMTVDDLRFTRSEVEQLFKDAYRRPLDGAACDIVMEKTQGWAASLQLVSASIGASRPEEVGDFIETLSGAVGPIYDFLAEEVLTRLSPETQRVLLHAALLDRIRPELVTAAMSVTEEGPQAELVVSGLADAETLGLLGERARATGGSRMHPLFRQFLMHHLTASTPEERVRAMHRAVAADAAASDWLVAGKHYALAAAPNEAMQVLGSAACEALGTGAWGAAVEIVELMPETSPPPAVEVIRARALVANDSPLDALSLLDEIDRVALSPEERGLVALTSASACHLEGAAPRTAQEVESVAADASVPDPLRAIALSWWQMLIASRGGCITDAVNMLRRLSTEQREAGLHYFAGVTLHNSANAELARANYQRAIELSEEAIVQLSMTDEGDAIAASTRSVSASAVAETGRLAEGLRLASAAATEPGATADAIAEAAYMHAVSGRSLKAKALLARFDRGDARWSREVSARAQGCYARVALHVGEGDFTAARTVLTQLDGLEAADVDAMSRTATIAATVAVAEGSHNARDLAEKACEIATSQHAWRWLARARILKAASCGDSSSLALWISEVENESALSLLELADAIAASVGMLVPLPEALERSILQAPTRWVEALGRQVRLGRGDNSRAAASLIARYGTLNDASVLRQFDSAPSGKTKRRGLATQLIRRVSPTVRVHDLGPTSYEIGDRRVTLTETRRKSATLLLYVISRPGLAAAKEQVMEALWPDQSPKSALNSLHQTLFFLRRDIEPWYEDGSTADYVRMESDLVFLDHDLFQVDSVAFNRQASNILASGSARERGPEMLRLYRGMFAPEFEYEEWAEDWRTQLHGVYLHLAHTTSLALIRDRRFPDAIEVLGPVAVVDPMAFDLRASLIACLAAVGSNDAAHAHYRSLSTLHQRDLGVPVRPFEEIVRGLDNMT